MQVHAYDSFIVNSLPEFNQVKDHVIALVPHVELLGGLIRDYNLTESIGVCLLHKHYNLFQGEAFVRRMEREKMVVRPEGAGQLGVVPFSWCFAKVRVAEPFGLFPMDFIADTEGAFAKDAVAVLSSSRFLNEAFALLARRGVERFLGLSLLPMRLFDRSSGANVLIENDLPHSRALEISSVSRGGFDGNSHVQTLWKFGKPSPSGWCVIHCGVHPPKCVVHCGVHIPSNPGDALCVPCKANPLWKPGVDALIRARDLGLITRDNWQSLLNETVFAIAEINALAGLIAAQCADCLNKEVWP